MPLLPPQNDLFPADLLDRPESIESGNGQWWALYTMARCEKKLMRQCEQLKIAFYAPLVKRRSRSAAGRVRFSHVPLFEGYVFLCGSDEHRRQALATNCVSRTLSVSDPSGLVHDLRQIQRLISLGAPLTPEARLEPGMRVRVRSGPLALLEGVVIQRRGKERLLVEVEFLQQGASVLLEDFLVERID